MRRLPVLFIPHRNADNETSSSTSATDQSRHPFEVSKFFLSSNIFCFAVGLSIFPIVHCLNVPQIMTEFGKEELISSICCS